MPFTVRKDGDKWAIVNADTGEVVGHSATESSAKASARIRNAKSKDT